MALAAEYNEQIANQLGFSVFTELNGVLLLESLKSHFDHPDCAVHDLLASCHYCLSLLTLEHGLGDLLGVVEVADSCLDDFDSSSIEAFLKLLLKCLPDLFAPTSKRQELVVRFLESVVGEHASEGAHGSLALYAHIFGVVVDTVNCTVSVVNLVNHDNSDLDGIAIPFVDLENLAIQIVILHGDWLLRVKWIHPEKAVVLHSSLVLPQHG